MNPSMSYWYLPTHYVRAVCESVRLPKLSCAGGPERSMPNSNLEQLVATTVLLRPILRDLVFVGGAVTILLVTDEGAGLRRWYRAAMEAATTHQLVRDLDIRVVTAPYFLATKIEAFKGRGCRDFWASHLSKKHKQRSPCFASTSTQKSLDCWRRPNSSTPCLATCCPMQRVRQESGQSFTD